LLKHLDKVRTISSKQRQETLKGPTEDILEGLLLHPYEAIIALGGLSLYEFVEAFFNEVSDDPYKPNWHIKVLCDALTEVAENVGNRRPKPWDVIINIPPGTTKSIICSVMFPAWCWTKWPWVRFITGSYAEGLALENAEKCRDILLSDKFKKMFPDIGIKDDKNTKHNYRIAQKQRDATGKITHLLVRGGRFTTSVGGTITGFHGHINVWDDPINPRQAASDVMLETANTWIDKSASTRKSDKAITTTILVMQRLHQNDPTGHLLAKEGKKYYHICLPGEIKTYKEFVSPPELAKYYSTEGLLDPVRLTWDSLKEMESDLGPYGYAGQIGQNPVPPGGGMFKVANFQYIQEMPTATHIQRIIRYWDKAGTTDAGAWTVGVKIARLTNNKVVIMDVVRGQWAAEVRERTIRKTAEADGRNVEIYIEQEPGSGGKESAEATVRNLIGFICHKDLPHGDKVYRAGPLAVQVNDGNVLLLHGHWNQAYVKEFEFFPFGKFKDQVDSSSAGFNLIAGKKVARRVT
jgi:predicted phage terminase large subunit-like protein